MASISQPSASTNSILKLEFQRLQKDFGADYLELRSFFARMIQKIDEKVPLKDIGYELTLHLNPAFLRHHALLLQRLQTIFHHHPELFGTEALAQIIRPSTFSFDYPELQQSHDVPKLLLMALSPLLELHLMKDLEDRKKSALCFQGMKDEASDLLVNYLETGDSVQIEGWIAFEIFKFAFSYRMTDLQMLCLKRLMEYFKESVDLDSLCDFWIYAEHYHSTDYNWVCFEAVKTFNQELYQEFLKRLKTKLIAIETIEQLMFAYVRELEAFTTLFRESRGLSLQVESHKAQAVILSLHVSTIQVLKEASQFFHIEMLKASHADITDDDLEGFPELLSYHETIKSLDLSFNHIGKRGAKAIQSILLENKILKSLNISYNPLSVEGAKAVVQGLKENQVLIRLNAAHIHCGVEGALAFSDMLAVNDTLMALDFSENPIDSFGHTIRQNRGLNELKMRKMVAREDEIRNLFEGLKNNEVIESLDLSFNDIFHSKLLLEAFSEMFYNNDTLRDLNLTKTGMLASVFRQLANVLMPNLSLKVLHLSLNEIDDREAKEMAHVLETSGIEELYLDKNSIGNEGARSLAEAMKNPKNCLKRLDLSYNAVSLDGAIVLAQSFSNPVLQEIELSHNKITEQDVLNLCLYLKEKNPYISRKDLSGTHIKLYRI